MQVILVQWSPRLVGKKFRKVKVFSSGVNGSNSSLMSISRVKICLLTSFSIEGIVHFELIPQGQPVSHAYVRILKLCIEKSLAFDPMIGFSTVKMHQLTRRSV
jgi:hypothetical protein